MMADWEREARNLRAVFIVGEARSGTTLLYRSLQAHPSFTPSSGLQLDESHAMQNLPELVSLEDLTDGPLAWFLLGQEALAAVLDDMQPLAARRRLVRRLVGPYEGRVWAWVAAGEHHVTRRYFLEAARRRGAQRLVEKTPLHLPWVPHLKFAFPNARFVYIIRHPIDTLTSYWRRFAADSGGSAWANIEVDPFCELWERNARFAVALQGREPGFLLMRYEELTSSSEGALRRLLEHLDEPFSEACLLQEVDERLTRSVDPMLARNITASTKRWEDFIDNATAGAVESRLAKAMALLGYEPRAAVSGDRAAAG